jgi:phenylpyruvate tautomerase PptA (4-oxalocrotonate tautomerase family)
MPLIDLTYPAGTLTPETRTTLGNELTTLMLKWEGAPDTEFFRGITWVHVHELPEGSVLAAGKPVDQSIFRVDVRVPEGALSDRRKAGLVEDFTATLKQAGGLGDDDGLRVWVLIHEVPDGNWGAGGQVIRFAQLREAAQAERERAEAAPAGSTA